jgi:uncharacterized membrane protein (UPF0127 family)
MYHNPKGHLFVVNSTKNTIIGAAEIADSFIARFRGLMLKRKLDKGLILKIPSGRGRKGSGIHMFFMLIPLDVIFLDENKEVVDMVTLKPWQIYTPKAPARYVMEFGKGILIRSSTEIGDKLDFTCENA